MTMDTTKKAYDPPKNEFGIHILAPGNNPVVDIIAIHGLDGHLTKSWTATNGTLWLADLLPQLGSESIYDLGKDLVSSIATERRISGIERRPIIFVAHSLGGIILKSGLLFANSASSVHNMDYKAVELSTHGLIFLGTPHQGGERIDLALLLLHIRSIYSNTNDAVLKELRLHSKSLQEQLERFAAISHRYTTKFYYEVYPTKLSASKSIKLVDQFSAVIPGMQNAESVGLKKDHIGMAKFGDRGDWDFQTLSSHLSSMVGNAPLQVADKWDRHKRHEEMDREIGSGRIVDVSVANEKESIAYKSMPASSENFMGRGDYLMKLREYFDTLDTRSKHRKTFVLHGTGGIGKSQLSIKFAEDNPDLFTVIFWLDATSDETIKLSLREIARNPDAKHSKVEDSPDSVLRWLAQKNEPWLIIYDNADGDPQVVIDHIPGGNKGNIIVTSRNPELRRITSREGSAEVGNLDEQDAISLLLKSAFLDENLVESRNMAEPIVKELFYLPLAVDQAGAAISSGLCDLGSYLQTYSTHRKHLMSHPSFKGASQYGRAVYGAYDLSFAAIEAKAAREHNRVESNAAKSAIAILCLFAFFHHEDISEDIIRRAAESPSRQESPSQVEHISRWKRVLDHIHRPLRTGKKKERPNTNKTSADHNLELLLRILELDKEGHWNRVPFREGIRILLSFSHIRRSGGGNAYSIHPLVHKWSRDRLSFEDQKYFMLAVIDILSRSIACKPADADHTFRRTLVPHIITNQIDAAVNSTELYNAEQCENFGDILHEYRYWKQAGQFRAQAVEEKQRQFGMEDPRTLASMSSLLRTDIKQGKCKEAEELGTQLTETFKRVLGAEHHNTLKSMYILASTYKYQGRLKEAEELCAQVTEAHKRALGTEHPDTLLYMSNLSLIYKLEGRLKEAGELATQVMGIRRRVLGAEHHNTLASMYNLASMYYVQGRLKKAEELGTQVTEIRQRVLGVEHHDTLKSMHNLALTYQSLGRLKDAEELSAHVLEIRQRMLGAEHPGTLRSMSHLARIFRDQGRLDEAEELKVRVVELAMADSEADTRNLGASDPNAFKHDTTERPTYIPDAKKIQA